MRFLFLLMVGFYAAPAMAYIDPGSGSAIMSAIVGFFAAILMVVKSYWYKIKSLFGGGKKDGAENKNEDSDHQTSSANKTTEE